jgi:hypothetical protein
MRRPHCGLPELGEYRVKRMPQVPMIVDRYYAGINPRSIAVSKVPSDWLEAFVSAAYNSPLQRRAHPNLDEVCQ